MPRPQFTLRALLVAMLAVACFFGGMVAQRQLSAPQIENPHGMPAQMQIPEPAQLMTMKDGSKWIRVVLVDDLPDRVEDSPAEEVATDGRP